MLKDSDNLSVSSVKTIATYKVYEGPSNAATYSGGGENTWDIYSPTCFATGSVSYRILVSRYEDHISADSVLLPILPVHVGVVIRVIAYPKSQEAHRFHITMTLWRTWKIISRRVHVHSTPTPRSSAGQPLLPLEGCS